MRKHFMRAVVFTLACALGTHGLAAAVRAQGNPEVPPPAKLVKIIVPPITVKAGDHVTAHVTLDVASGWHINANPPSPDYMVPTDVSIEGAGGVSTGTPRFPKGRGLKLDFDESELSVYDGSTATIDVEVAASAQAANGAHPLVGQLRFQACNNHLCLAPVALPFTLSVPTPIVKLYVPPPASARLAHLA